MSPPKDKLEGYRDEPKSGDTQLERPPAQVADDPQGSERASPERDDLPVRQEAEQEEAPPAPEPMLPADKRAALVARMAQKRSDERMGVEPSPEDSISPPFARPDFKGPDDAGDEPPEPPPVSDKAPADNLTLKINGKVVEMTRERALAIAEIDSDEAADYTDKQLIKLAQKHAAADDRLDEVKKLSTKARSIVRADDGQHPDREDDDQTERDDNPERSANTPAPLDEVVKEIQFGDPEVAAKKLDQAIQSAVAKTRTTERVADVDKETSQVFADFERDNPDIADDEDLSRLFSVRVADQAKSELARLFKTTKAEISRHLVTPQLIGAAYAEAKAKGYDIRPQAKIVADAVKHIRTKFNLPSKQPAPSGSPSLNARQQQKQALPQQARTGNPVPPPRQPQADRSPSNRIHAIRKMRGQAH